MDESASPSRLLRTLCVYPIHDLGQWKIYKLCAVSLSILFLHALKRILEISL